VRVHETPVVYTPGQTVHHQFMSKRTHVGVLGGGSWGTAIAHLLRSREDPEPTLMWLRDREVAKSIRTEGINPKYLPDLRLADGIEVTHDLAEMTERCDLLFAVIPTKVMRPVARELGDTLLPDHLLVSCSKGLEPGTAKRMTTILREETCCLKIGALSGPNLAKEVLRGDPSATVIASDYDDVVRRATRALMGSRFRVYGNNDVAGVELGGALKNVIAIAAGVAAGLGFGDNTKAMLVTRGLAEIRRLGVALGAEAHTFAGLAGVGDLMVTCASPLSRNHQVGRRLAKGQTLEEIGAAMNQVAEGVSTSRVVHELSQKMNIPMPISKAVYELAYCGRSPVEVLADLMTIDALYEIDTPIIF
jgi:glycerol-3-phosphate dehydrogenase (NAD(P)+)